MIVKINAKDLTALLRRVRPALPSTPIIPSTRMILLKVTEKLEAMCCDGHGFFLGATSKAIVESPGEVLVEPALLQIAESAGDAELVLSTKETRFYVSGYGDADMGTMDPKNSLIAPSVEYKNSISFTKDEISALGLSIATESMEHKPHNLGVSIFTEDDKVFCSTTDAGSWLTMIVLDQADVPDALVPFKYLAKAIKATGESRLGLGEKHAILRGPEAWSIFPLFESVPVKIAPYLLALESVLEITPDHKEMLKALKLCIRFSEKGSSIVTLSLTKDGLHIESGGNEYGSYERSIECSSNVALDLKAKFNSAKLFAMLKDAGEGARIELCPAQGFHAARISKGNNISYLIMGMA